MHYDLTDSDRRLAKYIAQARCEAKPAHIRFNDSGFHKDEDGTTPDKNQRWYPHMIGILGEIAWMRMNKLPLFFTIESKGDNIDFGETEIKTRCTDEDNPMLIIKKKEFEKKEPKEYVLLRLDTAHTRVTVLGRIARDEFASRCEEKWYFQRPCFVMAADQLEAVR